MKNSLLLIACTFLGYHVTATANCHSLLATKAGAVTTAIVGGYVAPTAFLSFFNNPFSAAKQAIPPFVGAAVACLLQRQGISAKWGCNNVTRSGDIATWLTYFGFAFVADEVAQNFVPGFATSGGPVDAAGRAAVTTAGLWAAFTGRNWLIK